MFGSDRALSIPEELRPPGWVELGREFSLLDDPLYPKDRIVSRALQRLEPTLVPLSCRWVFLGPADAQTGERERVVFKRHALGRTDMKLDLSKLSADEGSESMKALALTSLEVPPDWIGPRPGFLDPTVGVLDDPAFLGLPAVADDPRTVYKAPDLPGPFVPWDWTLYRALERMHTPGMTAKVIIADRLHAPELRRKKRAAAMRDAFARDFLGFQKWANAEISSMPDHEIAAQIALQQRRREAALVKGMAERELALRGRGGKIVLA